MNSRLSRCRLLLVLLPALCLTGCRPAVPEEEYDLVHAMAMLQRWSDKVYRAAAQENWPLVNFYLHELEETVEGLGEAGVVYEGVEVSRLVRQMLDPAVEGLEEAVKQSDAALFRQRYDDLIISCNQCHQVSGYAFLRITTPNLNVNPWPQDFSAR
jgi:hypothetical protein